jgi:hypothetical protein
MPELIDVPLVNLEMGEEYSVIFPIGDIHEAYDAEFVQDNTQEYLFEIVMVHAGTKSVGDRFSVRVGEQTFDIADRVGKYLILTEEVIPFPDDLADAHVDTSTDAEIGAIFAQGDRDNMRMRLLNRLLMRSRSPTRSPLRRLSPMSPFSRSQTPLNGGRRRRRRTRRRPARKRPSRRRSRSTRRRPRARRRR